MSGILIVDDDASIRFAVADYFSAKGYRAESVESLEAAESCLAERHYAIVLTDLRLNQSADESEGLKVVRLVAERFAATACIVITAYGSPESEATAMRCGARAFLHKPQPMSDLLDLVKNLLLPGSICRTNPTPTATSAFISQT